MQRQGSLARERILIAAAAFLLSLPVCARAANTWDGGGTSYNWSDRFNWDDDQVPAFPAAITFSGFTGGVPHNDLNGLTVNGITFNSSQSYTLDGNAITLAGNINATSWPEYINFPIALSNGTTITGEVTTRGTLSGTGDLVKLGTADLTMSAANSYSGDTILDGGQLIYTVDQPNVHSITMGATAGNNPNFVKLDFSHSSVTSTGLTVQNGQSNQAIIGAVASRTWTINGPIAVGGFDPGNTSATSEMTFGTALGSSVNVNAGSGNLVVGGNSTGAGTATGEIDFSNGSFSFSGNEVRIGGGQANNSGNRAHGTVTFGYGNNSLTATVITVGGGSNTVAGNGQLNLGLGTNTINADTIYVGTQRSSGTLNGGYGLVLRNRAGNGRAALIVGWQNTSAANFGDSMSTTGSVNLLTSGDPADVVLSTLTIGQATNSVAHIGSVNGGVILGNGNFDVTTVQMGNSTVPGVTVTASLGMFGSGTMLVNSPSGPGGGSFTLGSGIGTSTAATASFNVGGGTAQINCDISLGGPTSTTHGNVMLTGGTLDMMGHSIGSSSRPITLFAESGTLENLAQLNGGLNLTTGSQSSDVLVLAGTNTYTGATTVSQGKALLNGTNSGGGRFTVKSGATLGGTGSTTSPVTVNAGGFLSPGASIESLDVGATTLSGALDIDLNDADANVVDVLNVSGALDISSATSAVDFNALGTLSAPAYEFASYDSLTGTQFASVTDLPSGYTIDYHYNDGADSNNIALVAVPEPDTAVLSVIGVASLMGFVARRRR